MERNSRAIADVLVRMRLRAGVPDRVARPELEDFAINRVSNTSGNDIHDLFSGMRETDSPAFALRCSM